MHYQRVKFIMVILLVACLIATAAAECTIHCERTAHQRNWAAPDNEPGAAAATGSATSTQSSNGVSSNGVSSNAGGLTAGLGAGCTTQAAGSRQRQLVQQQVHYKHERQLDEQGSGPPQHHPHQQQARLVHHRHPGSPGNQQQQQPGSASAPSEGPPASGGAAQAALPGAPLQPGAAASESAAQAASSQQQPSQASSQQQLAAASELCGSGIQAQAVQGANHTFWLSRKQLLRGLTYVVPNERLRLALHRAMSGGELLVSTIGGSITAGQGCSDKYPAYPAHVEAWLNDTMKPFGTRFKLANGALPGTTSALACMCLRSHAPLQSDIVLVEFTANDPYTANPPFDNKYRRPYERLIRKLLMLPRAPAVVLVHSFPWFALDARPHDGAYYNSIENQLDEFGRYYDLPAVSIKGCCYHAMRQGLPGFRVDATSTNAGGVNASAAFNMFFSDLIHPDGRTGHRAYADLIIHLFQKTFEDLAAHPVTAGDEQAASRPLPPPMLSGNHASLANRCLIGPVFLQTIVMEPGASGWAWVNEALPGRRTKWGMVSNVTGSAISLRVNTTAAMGAADAPVLVQLVHLKSYEHMGIGLVCCVSGCTCRDSSFNGHWGEHSSQTTMHSFYATQAPDCVIRVTVGDASSTGGHKVKLTGVIISEVSGASEGIGSRDDRAVAAIHDGSHRHLGYGVNGTFDIRNHGRRMLTGAARQWRRT